MVDSQRSNQCLRFGDSIVYAELFTCAATQLSSTTMVSFTGDVDSVSKMDNLV